MKEKIFDLMEKYGWSLESFESVYKIHYDFLQSLYDYFVETDEPNCSRDLNEIDEQRLHDMVDFMSDFVRAINDIDKNTSITTQDIMIIDKGLNTQITSDIILLNDRERVGNETREEMSEEIDSFLGGTK